MKDMMEMVQTDQEPDRSVGRPAYAPILPALNFDTFQGNSSEPHEEPRSNSTTVAIEHLLESHTKLQATHMQMKV
jgi:hypothetical protein